MSSQINPSFKAVPHKHSDMIKQWADGAEIEYKSVDTNNNWRVVKNPSWTSNNEYRVKNKHQELIDAHAKGAMIQFVNYEGVWVDCYPNNPLWDADTAYRIKPEPKEDYRLVGRIELYSDQIGNYDAKSAPSGYVKDCHVWFDGETNEFKKVEIIR